MSWRLLLSALLLLVPAIALAGPSGECAWAVAAAERAHGIPPRLLASIARVESGRRDAVSGALEPWPWTINLDGQGSFYDDKAQAIAAARSMQPRVTRSLDVGCMQISLTNHPDAFPNLATAFDPVANADYGARFLFGLYQKTNSWAKAVEMYHSATPEIGQPYRERVYAVWRGEGDSPIDGAAFPLAAAWAATVNRPSLPVLGRQVPPRVVRQAPSVLASSAPGHTLAFYRASPVRMAFQAPTRATAPEAAKPPEKPPTRGAWSPFFRADH